MKNILTKLLEVLFTAFIFIVVFPFALIVMLIELFFPLNISSCCRAKIIESGYPRGPICSKCFEYVDKTKSAPV